MLALLTMLAAGAVPALPAADTLFAGDARIIPVGPGGEAPRERVLLVRRVEPQRGRIVEHACVVPVGGAAMLSSAYLTVEGSRFTISDRESGQGGMLSGTGRLVGPAWAWTELHFDMLYALPRLKMRVLNLNLMAPGRLLARKQVAVDRGPIVQLWETELDQVDGPVFRAEWQRRGCPPL